MNKYLYSVLGVAAVLAAVGAWIMLKPQPAGNQPAPATETTNVSGMVEAAPEVMEAEPQPEAERSTAMPPARRIRHGTAIAQDLSNAVIDLPSSGNERSDRLRRRVEAALEGDVDGLIDLSRKINQCGRGMGSEAQVQARLDRAAEIIARNPDAPIRSSRGGGGGSVEYQSVEDMEADLWAQFDGCRVVKDVMDETLYEQVSRLAETGVPSARYLYAVWPPDQDSLLEVDSLELLEYQSLALEYTWMNMQARNPLGLLAMSQSYSANRPAMFTPRNGIQSQVFRLASMKCGIDNEWLTNRAMNFGQGFSRFQAEHTGMPSLEDDAAVLAERFCPREIESK
jgi:hypothetical protein